MLQHKAFRGKKTVFKISVDSSKHGSKSTLTILSENMQLLRVELFPTALLEVIVIPSDNYSKTVCSLTAV